MLHPTLMIAASAERLIGLVYTTLATSCESDSGLGRVLEKLAIEEELHAGTLEKLCEEVPSDYSGYDYPAVLRGQADFIGRCVQLIHEAQSASPDIESILHRLIKLEGTLSESWLVHLKLLVNEPPEGPVAALAAASARHAQRLADFLPQVEDSQVEDSQVED